MPSPSTPLDRNQRYKTSLDWAAQMVSVVSRWLKRSWICVADGAYGNAKFGWACRRHGVTLVARLPWKANLYDFAPVAPPRRQRGRPRTKGALLPSMQQQFERLSHPTQLSDRLPPIVSSRFQILRWYGGTHALRQLVTGTAVWDVDGYPPLPLRWVLVVDPTGQQPPAALFSTNLALGARAIVELFVSRWSLEVTFEEARAHLGFQSQRQWAKAATTRTTPVILAIFSLICLIAHRLHAATPLAPHSTAWYSKSELTFADLLDAVRLCLCRAHFFSRPAFHSALALFSDDEREQLIQLLTVPF